MGQYGNQPDFGTKAKTGEINGDPTDTTRAINLGSAALYIGTGGTLICRVVGGTVDGYIYNEETEGMDMVPNMDIFEQYGLLEYDTGDFEQYLKDECYSHFYSELKHIGLPIHVDLMVR
jgi:hypothetical protein